MPISFVVVTNCHISCSSKAIQLDIYPNRFRVFHSPAFHDHSQHHYIAITCLMQKTSGYNGFVWTNMILYANSNGISSVNIAFWNSAAENQPVLCCCVESHAWRRKKNFVNLSISECNTISFQGLVVKENPFRSFFRPRPDCTDEIETTRYR